MQNVSVSDGDNAIVGNVTQHASVIVEDKNPTEVPRKDVSSRRRRADADAERGAQA